AARALQHSQLGGTLGCLCPTTESQFASNQSILVWPDYRPALLCGSGPPGDSSFGPACTIGPSWGPTSRIHRRSSWARGATGSLACSCNTTACSARGDGPPRCGA